MKRQQNVVDTTQSKVNIFDLILQEQEAQFEVAPISSKTRVVNAENFYKENDADGFCTKEGQLALYSQLSKNELQKLDKFLEKISNGESFDGNPSGDIDKDGRLHFWARFRLKNGTQPFKIFTTENMSELFELYQAGELTCNLSLESLYKAAKS